MPQLGQTTRAPGRVEETAASRAAARPIHQTANQGEINALIRRVHDGTATDAERLRLAAMTFTPDEPMERARLLRDRHPDVYGQVPSNTKIGLQKTYEPNRMAAVAAGRFVPDPSAEVVAEIDFLAAEYEATKETPAEFQDLESRHREAFVGAIAANDFNAALHEWAAWLSEHKQRNKFLVRRAAALNGLGRPGGPGDGIPPSRFLHELEDAVGGSKAWRSVGR